MAARGGAGGPADDAAAGGAGGPSKGGKGKGDMGEKTEQENSISRRPRNCCCEHSARAYPLSEIFVRGNHSSLRGSSRIPFWLNEDAWFTELLARFLLGAFVGCRLR